MILGVSAPNYSALNLMKQKLTELKRIIDKYKRRLKKSMTEDFSNLAKGFKKLSKLQTKNTEEMHSQKYNPTS